MGRKIAIATPNPKHQDRVLFMSGVSTSFFLYVCDKVIKIIAMISGAAIIANIIKDTNMSKIHPDRVSGVINAMFILANKKIKK